MRAHCLYTASLHPTKLGKQESMVYNLRLHVSRDFKEGQGTTLATIAIMTSSTLSTTTPRLNKQICDMIHQNPQTPFLTIRYQSDPQQPSP